MIEVNTCIPWLYLIIYSVLATSHPNKPVLHTPPYTPYGPTRTGTRSTEPVSLGKTRKRVSDQMDPNGWCRRLLLIGTRNVGMEKKKEKEKRKKKKKEEEEKFHGRK